MPAAIAVDFSKKHLTKEEKEKKKQDKASVTPSVKLKPPPIIQGNIAYLSRWKDVLKLYKGTDLLNALDTDLLARYCIEKYNLEDLYLERGNDEVRGNIELRLKIETRIEAKTKMLNQMALALYMTPRARAGAVPNQPDKEAKDDPNADMFD
jgi:phage terminase small subunit